MVVTVYTVSGPSVWGWIGGKNRMFKKGEHYGILGDRARTMKVLGRCSITSYTVPLDKEKAVAEILPINVWKKLTQVEFDRIVGLCRHEALAPVVVAAPPPVVVVELQKPSEILAQLEPPVEVVEEKVAVVEEKKEEVIKVKEEKIEIKEDKTEEVKIEDVVLPKKESEDVSNSVEEKLGNIERIIKKRNKKNGKK